MYGIILSEAILERLPTNLPGELTDESVWSGAGAVRRPARRRKNYTIGAVDRQDCSLINHSFGGFTMVRFMGRALLLGLILSVSAVTAQAQYGRYGGWGGWGGGASSLQGDMMRGAGVAAAGAGAYNQQTAVARSINANTAMQVNQYMYEVNKTNAKYYYTRSANKQKEASSTGEAIYKRLHDDPSGLDIHTGDALNVVLDELTNPAVYAQVISSSTRPIDSAARQEHPVSIRRQHDRDQPGGLQRARRSRLPMTTEDFAPDRAAIKAIAAKVRSEIQSQGQASARDAGELLAWRSRLLKAKADRPLAARITQPRSKSTITSRLSIGLSKMLETPSVDQYLAQLKKGETTTLGHLIAFMHTFNLRFGAAKTPVQEQTYDQLYPLARGDSRPGQGSQREPLHHLEWTAGPQSSLRVFLRDAVRLEARRSAPAAARPALMNSMKQPSL